MSEPAKAEAVVRDFMATFLSTRPMGDASVLACFFSEDAEYRNGPLDPVTGRDAIVACLTSMMALGGEIDVDIIHFVSGDSVVLTERIDYVRLEDKVASLRIAGVFEVHGSVITACRDYFDPAEFSLE